MSSLPVKQLAFILILLFSLVSTSVYFIEKQNFETRTRAEEPISSKEAESISKTKNYPVTYQNSKFTPEKITVKFGESVTWINKSTNNLWVASGPHPSHALYPEFDSINLIIRLK